MTEFTDQIIRQRLMDPDVRQAYHVDAHYHAEWTLFSRALDAAHRALVAYGQPEAERIVEALSHGAPDPAASRQRVEEARKLIQWHESPAWHPRESCPDRGSCDYHAITTAF